MNLNASSWQWLRPEPRAAAALCIAALMAAAGCSHRSANASSSREAGTEPSARLIVPATKVARTELTGDITLTGEFIPFQEVDVMSKVAGYVKSIQVDIGDRVRTGQLLATLEIPEMEDDLAKANAAIDQHEANVITARDQLRRAESAHHVLHLAYQRVLEVSEKEKGLVPMQELDEAHSKDLESEAQVAAAKSNLNAAQQLTRVSRAEQARLKTLYRYASITAPFDGVVTKRYANTGSMIQAGITSQTQAMPLVRLSQNALLRLVLPVPESAVPRIKRGGTVDVRVPSLNRTFAGKVTRYTDTVATSTRTMNTEVDVPNSSFTLVPGMYAEVHLQLERLQNVLSVPLDALERSANGNRAYVIADGGAIHIVPVETGFETSQRVEIRSGLKEGEVVITGRHAGLMDGQTVQAKLIDEVKIASAETKGN